jgi:hypothetical protein
MTPNQFRRAALSLPGVIEGSHMGHADFRVGGKIFATLGYPNASFGMVQLTPEQQTLLVETVPKIFTPVPGGWGLRGSTHVRLAAADQATLKSALTMAWQNRAPKKLMAERAKAGPAIAKRKAAKKR